MLNDDFVETDGGVHNVRVFNNRGVNAAHGGYSAQPVFGGPVYFIGNISYHVPSGVAFKFSAKPAGLFVYHNTIIGEQTARDPSSNMHFRNNLFLGRDTPDRGDHDLGQRHARHTAPTTTAIAPTRASPRSTRGSRPQPGQRSYEPKPEDWKSFRHAGRASRRHRPGSARHRSRFRHLRATDAARSGEAPRRLSRDGSELPAEAVGQGRGRRRGHPHGQRRVRRAERRILVRLEVGEPEPRYGPRWLTWQPFYR